MLLYFLVYTFGSISVICLTHDIIVHSCKREYVRFFFLHLNGRYIIENNASTTFIRLMAMHMKFNQLSSYNKELRIKNWKRAETKWDTPERVRWLCWNTSDVHQLKPEGPTKNLNDYRTMSEVHCKHWMHWSFNGIWESFHYGAIDKNLFFRNINAQVIVLKRFMGNFMN